MNTEKPKKSILNNSLILIPTPISEDVNSTYISSEYLYSLDFFIVESLKMARRNLRKLGYKKDFDTEVQFFEIDKHVDVQDPTKVKKWMEAGHNIGLMSDAGTPCIADPGHQFVLLAHSYNYYVHPLVGPSSIILGLMASGLNGQNFHFRGYLPIEKIKRRKTLELIQRDIIQNKTTNIFIETPYRNKQIYGAILETIQPNLYLSLACGLQSSEEYIETKTIEQWKKSDMPDFHKIPTIFLLGVS